MLQKPTLSLVAKGGIEELRERWGVEPTIEEQIWLHELGKRVENPPGVIPLDVLAMPARINGVTLWPFSIGSAIWWRKYALEWFDDNPAVQDLCLAFALAHSKDPDTLIQITTRSEALTAINQWAARCAATREELEWAIGKVLPPADGAKDSDEEEDEDDTMPTVDHGALISTLIKAYGNTREYWVWDETQDVALGLLAKANELQQAATHHAGVTDSYKAAMSQFRAALMQIVKDHKEADNG